MLSQSQKTPFSIDRERFDALADPIARAHGAEIVDVEFKTEQGGWVLRVFVEKVGASSAKLSTKDAAVNLELCSNVARELSPALDVADMIPHRYHLEVSSPGVERSLKKREDVGRFVGEKAKFWLSKPCAGQKVVTGIIASQEGDLVTLSYGADNGKTMTFSFDDVQRGRLVFEYGPASARSGPPSKNSSSKQKKHQ